MIYFSIHLSRISETINRLNQQDNEKNKTANAVLQYYWDGINAVHWGM